MSYAIVTNWCWFGVVIFEFESEQMLKQPHNSQAKFLFAIASEEICYLLRSSGFLCYTIIVLSIGSVVLFGLSQSNKISVDV